MSPDHYLHPNEEAGVFHVILPGHQPHLEGCAGAVPAYLINNVIWAIRGLIIVFLNDKSTYSQ
jgi:hypothetical protein